MDFTKTSFVKLLRAQCGFGSDAVQVQRALETTETIITQQARKWTEIADASTEQGIELEGHVTMLCHYLGVCVESVLSPTHCDKLSAQVARLCASHIATAINLSDEVTAVFDTHAEHAIVTVLRAALFAKIPDHAERGKAQPAAATPTHNNNHTSDTQQNATDTSNVTNHTQNQSKATNTITGNSNCSGTPVFYLHQHSPHTSSRLCALLGLGDHCARIVPCCHVTQSSPVTMDIAQLEQMIENDLEAGMIPFCVILQAGTLAVQHTDNIPLALQHSRRHRIWCHVEGASSSLLVAQNTPDGLHPAILEILEVDSFSLETKYLLPQPHIDSVSPVCTFYNSTNINKHNTPTNPTMTAAATTTTESTHTSPHPNPHVPLNALPLPSLITLFLRLAPNLDQLKHVLNPSPSHHMFSENTIDTTNSNKDTASIQAVTSTKAKATAHSGSASNEISVLPRVTVYVSECLRQARYLTDVLIRTPQVEQYLWDPTAPHVVCFHFKPSFDTLEHQLSMRHLIMATNRTLEEVFANSLDVPRGMCLLQQNLGESEADIKPHVCCFDPLFVVHPTIAQYGMADKHRGSAADECVSAFVNDLAIALTHVDLVATAVACLAKEASKRGFEVVNVPAFEGLLTLRYVPSYLARLDPPLTAQDESREISYFTEQIVQSVCEDPSNQDDDASLYCCVDTGMGSCIGVLTLPDGWELNLEGEIGIMIDRLEALCVSLEKERVMYTLEHTVKAMISEAERKMNESREQQYSLRHVPVIGGLINFVAPVQAPANPYPNNQPGWHWELPKNIL